MDREPLVHGGFYVNQRSTWFDVQSTLLDAVEGKSVLRGVPLRNEAIAKPDDDSHLQSADRLEALFVTGHSLGGGVAANAAVRLAHDGRARNIVEKIRGVYTFGQPMIGNEAWAKMLTGDEKRYSLLTRGLFRHVFDRDPVPSLPPVEAGSFVHTGVEYRTPEPLGEQPTWLRQEPHVRRSPMPSSELPLAFLAFVKRQLPKLKIFEGGELKLPAVAVESLKVIGTSFLQVIPKVLLSTTILHNLTPLIASLRVGVPKLEPQFSIYDHLPANYVMCSTPPGKLNEFGDF
jgi:hypothetical protein